MTVASPRPRPVRRRLDRTPLPVDAAPTSSRSPRPRASLDWLLADRHAAFEPSRRCRPSRTCCTRRTSTCAPPQLPTPGSTARRGPRRSRRAARRQPTACSRSIEGDVIATALSPRRPRPACRLTTSATCSRRDPDRVARAPRRAARAPRRRPVRPADPGVWTQGVVLDVPAGVRLDPADHRPLGRRRAGSRRCCRGPSSRSATAPRRRSSRSSSARRGGARRSDAASRSSPARSRSSSAGRDARRREPPGAAGHDRRLPAPRRRHRRGRGAPLGARPARLRLVRSRVDNRLDGDRSSVEQVEIVFGGERPAVRPDLVHPAHRPRHDRQPAVQGRAARPRAGVHEGHDRRSSGARSGRTASSASSG